MIAACIDSWGGFGLALTRITAVIVSVVVVVVMIRNLRHSELGTVPKPILVFTTAWAAVLGVCAVGAVNRCGPIDSSWYAAIYVSAFIWTIVGLLWIIMTIEKTVRTITARANTYADTVQTLIEDDEMHTGG